MANRRTEADCPSTGEPSAAVAAAAVTPLGRLGFAPPPPCEDDEVTGPALAERRPSRAVVSVRSPVVESGRFPAKRVVGDIVVIEADAFADGHDRVLSEVWFRHEKEVGWSTVPMSFVGNDRWQGAFRVERTGLHQFAVRAAVDSVAAMESCERRDRELSWSASPIYRLEVERRRAGFGSWYELFPRSASPEQGRQGTFADVIGRLSYLEELAVDVLYLPPIHPIGTTNRKGRDGSPTTATGDPGSPWAIGSSSGGHTDVDPALGTIEDFDALVESARGSGIEIALDLAYQCSPDHPWVKQHPQWFRHLPDGSIAYAENPPKRYEDIYPFDFDTTDWRALWEALFQVVLFWIEHRVRIFRVDNPHTKPLRFWQWLIAAVRAEHPDVIFLSEAFTRPRLLEHLAKIGFSQSYTYFTWRTSKYELEGYMAELTGTDRLEYLRPSLWPNTPDILHATLQRGGRGAFIARLVLAATLSANYGIYGPAFELQCREARSEGSEEYLHSEKYEVRHWDLVRADSLSGLVGRLNQVRRQHPCLQQNSTLRFHRVDNDQLIAYSKTAAATAGPGGAEVSGGAAVGTPEASGGAAVPGGAEASGNDLDVIIAVVNLDSRHVQSGWLELDLHALGLRENEAFEVHDLLTDARYRWKGAWNFVLLDPDAVPAHVFHVRRLEP
ncbi:MAG: maltotransferase domain-containing protein [Acidimicrobiales bacterium]